MKQSARACGPPGRLLLAYCVEKANGNLPLPA